MPKRYRRLSSDEVLRVREIADNTAPTRLSASTRSNAARSTGLRCLRRRSKMRASGVSLGTPSQSAPASRAKR